MTFILLSLLIIFIAFIVRLYYSLIKEIADNHKLRCPCCDHDMEFDPITNTWLCHNCGEMLGGDSHLSI